MIWARQTTSAVRDTSGRFLHSIAMIEDVTELRRGEAELRDSEDRYRAMVDSLSDGVLVTDEESSERLFVNRAYVELHGYADESEALATKTYSRVHAEDQERIMASQGTSEPNGLTQFCVQRPDGTIRSVGATRTAIVYRGRPSRLIVVRDMTAEVEPGQARQASEIRFRSLFEAAPIGIAMVGADRKILAANPAMANIVGTSVDALEAGYFGQAPGHQTGKPDTTWDQVVSGEIDHWRNEWETHNSDGTSSWALVTSSVVKDEHGEFAYAIRMVEDFSGIKRAEREARDSTERFRMLFDSAPLGIALVNLDGKIEEANSAIAGILGRSADTLKGGMFRDWMPPGSISDTAARRRMAAGEIVDDEREVSYARPDGSIVETFRRTFAIVGPDGLPQQLIRTLEDITARKELERTKKEFLAMTSHELKTPVTAIHAAVGLVASGVLGAMPEQAQQLLETAGRNSDRLIKLVEDILYLERLDLGQAPLDVSLIEASELTNEVASLLGMIASEAQVTINVRGQHVEFMGDKPRLVQALTNLVGNALKFSPPGTLVEISSHLEGEAIEFQVVDQGRGVPAGQRELIFERFQQVDASDTRDFGGTGLGLAITKAIIERHNGRIWVESESGMGSTFKFVLPLR